MSRAVLAFQAVNNRGGVERVVRATVHHLVGKGHDVELLTASADDRTMSSGAVVHLVAAEAPERVRGIAFWYAASRYQVHDAPLGTFGAFVPVGGLVWVQSVHAAWFRTSQGYRRGLERWRQRANPFHPIAIAAERRHYRPGRYRHLLALAPQVAADLQEIYGVPPCDITTLPNGFDPAEVNPGRRSVERTRARDEVRIDEHVPLVLFVANEIERKGLPTLCRALKRLRDRPVHLLTVGRLPVHEVRALVDSAGLGERHRHVASTSDVGRWFAAADVFCLPTAYEPWGMVIVEALAAGVPVVTTRLAGAARAVDDGTTGVLVDDPKDDVALASALERALGLRTMPEEIAATVDDYRWSQILERYEQLLFS